MWHRGRRVQVLLELSDAPRERLHGVVVAGDREGELLRDARHRRQPVDEVAEVLELHPDLAGHVRGLDGRPGRCDRR